MAQGPQHGKAAPTIASGKGQKVKHGNQSDSRVRKTGMTTDPKGRGYGGGK